MGRAIDIVFCESASRLTLERATRDRLYGFARRIGLDAAGRECASALLTRDGRLVLGPGGTAGVYLDERGDVVAREDLAASDHDGARVPDSVPSDPGPIEVTGPGPAEALLAHTATAVYMIADLDPAGPLAAALAAGDIYQTSVRAIATGRDGAAFLLANEHGAFLVAAEPARFEFVGADRPATFDHAWDDEEDDLGFDEVGFAR